MNMKSKVKAVVAASSWGRLVCSLVICSLVFNVGCSSVTGPDPIGGSNVTLAKGTAAPALSVASWIGGDPVSKFEPGKVYVVEFWATWCGPCVSNMPHLATLQSKYQDEVRFIGVTDEDNETVQGFLAKQHPTQGKTFGEIINYTLALDDQRQTNANYMEAANQNGIPTAFIVGKDGIVSWIGHPAKIDRALAEAVSK